MFIGDRDSDVTLIKILMITHFLSL